MTPLAWFIVFILVLMIVTMLFSCLKTSSHESRTEEQEGSADEQLRKWREKGL